MEVRLWQTALLTFVVLHGSNVSGSPVEVLRDLKLRAQYHLHSFKRNLDSIRALQDQITNSDKIGIRSVDDLLRWDLYLSPILTFCEDLKHLKLNMNSTTSPNTTPPSTTISPHRNKDGFILSTRPYDADDKKPEWYLPAVRPIRAQAERDGTKVRLVFDVIHSKPAYAVRVNSFQYAKAYMKAPAGASGNFLSEVQFVTDASACSSGEFDFEGSYQFMPVDLEEGGTFMRIDTCGFDKYQNMSLEYEERTWLTKNATIEEKPQYPSFRIVSRTGSNTLVRRGRNTQIDVDLRLDSTSMFFVSGNFYDYALKIPFEDSTALKVQWRGGLRVERSRRTRIKLIKLKVLKFVTSKNKTGVEDPDQSTNATVRITVLTSGTNLGGNLVLHAISYKNEYYERSLIHTVAIDRVLKFDQPGEHYPPPDMEPRIRAHNITVCTEEGNTIFPREGPNCTLSCNAYGQNIFNISIYKNDSKLVPYRSISYVLDSMAFAMIDVGLASSENEGLYLCVVESSNGRVESSSTLYTTGFPKIIREESTLVQFDNGTSEVTCKAMGASPLKMKISVRTEDGPYERIDNNSSYSRTRQRFDKGMVLKLRLPTKDLKFPKYILNCEAENDRRYDSMQHYLYNDVKYYYESVAPKLDEESTRIIRFKNGTTAITCKASGAFPLDVMVLYGGRSEHFRIDKDSSNVKMESSTNQSKTATLLVETKSIQGRTSWLHCFAMNKYGSDILDYDLDDYNI